MRQRSLSLLLAFLMVALLFAGCTAAKGSVRVKQGSAPSKLVDLTELPTVSVQGKTVDAEGNVVSVDAQGILLCDIFTAGEIEPSWIGDVTVQARDKTTASVTGAELNMANKAYLTLQDDGSWDLIVLSSDDAGFMLKDVVLLHGQNI